MNGVFNWLKSIDERFVDESRDRAASFGARQGELSAEQAKAVSDAIVSGQLSADTLAPELLHHLMQQKRGRVPADSGLGKAQAAMAGVVGPGSMPADGSRASKDALIQMLMDRGMATGEVPARNVFTGVDQQRQLYELANQVGQLRSVASPTMGSGVQGMLAGANNAFANNAYARGAAYTGLTGAAGAGAVGLTEAGQALLELAGVLDAEDEEGSPMPRR
jgi:hypothetical protein